MKETFDRHAARLTPEERRAIWSRISEARAGRGRATMRWAVPALATVATVVVAVSVIAVLQREESLPWNSTAERFLRSSAPVPSPAPTARPARPEARSAGEAAGRGRARPTAAQERPAKGAAPRIPRVGDSGPLAEVSPQAAIPTTPERPSSEEPRIDPSEALRRYGPAAPSLKHAGVLEGHVIDPRSGPVPFANVTVPSTRQGAQTDEDGKYVIVGVPAGPVEVRATALGYNPQRQTARVVDGGTATLDFTFGEQKIVRELESIDISVQRRIDTRLSSTTQSISAERVKEIPVDNLRVSTQKRAGAVAQGGELHFRGGRGGPVGLPLGGTTATPPTPPVVPTTGGTRLPNDEAFDSMFFRDYGVNPFVATDEDPLSTFAVDVDAASYTLTRRYLGLGQRPPRDAVRVEEFVNFFPQDYPRFENEDFRILVNGAPSPFGPGYQLLRIGIKGREVSESDRKPAQLTFVIDVSGSMDRENRLELVKRGLRLLVDELRADDRVGIVVYNTQGRVLLEPVTLGRYQQLGPDPRTEADERHDDARRASGRGRRRALEAIEALTPGGSTNAEEGLRLGYAMARRAYRPGAINRIVLCSDGVANVGVTGPETILARVRGEADRGIHLTTIGVGMGNYNDVLMEQLADQGDGNHYYVDDLDEARRVLVEHLAGTLQTIAKDAKVQVEFDSTRVTRYRLLGFENRDVADRDFRNDKVDAGEIGAGHEITALYEVKLAPGAAPGRLATVRFRYARPEYEGAGAPRVRELERTFDVAEFGRRFEDAAPRFRMDAAVAEFAEILRGSYWARDGRLADVLTVAREAARQLGDARSTEFVTLVEKAAALGLGPKSEGRGGTK